MTHSQRKCEALFVSEQPQMTADRSLAVGLLETRKWHVISSALIKLEGAP